MTIKLVRVIDYRPKRVIEAEKRQKRKAWIKKMKDKEPFKKPLVKVIL